MILHLVHPACVHFTIAFLVAGGIAEAWGAVSGRAGMERFGGMLVLLGSACLLVTIVTGFVAANTVDLPARAAGAMELHERMGLALGALFLVALAWKGWARGQIPERQKTAYAMLLAVGVTLVLGTAWMGGRLVYGEGIGVLAR